MPEASSVIEPSPEFIDDVLSYIGARVVPTVSEVIDAMRSKFPETFTRDDVKFFVIKALRALTEAGKIDTKFVSLKDKEENIVYLI